MPHPNPLKAGAIFTCQSICNFFTPHPANYVSPHNKGLWAWCSWLSWLPGWPASGLPVSGHLASGHAHTRHPGSHHSFGRPYFPYIALNLCLSLPTPTLATLILFQNGSPTSPACTPVDSLTCNSLLHW